MGVLEFRDREKIPKIKRDLMRLFENVAYVGNYMTKSDRVNFGTPAMQCIWNLVELFDVAYSCSDETKPDKIDLLYNRMGSLINLFEIMQRRHVIKEKKNQTDKKSGEINSPGPASFELGIFTIIGEVDGQITSWKNKYNNIRNKNKNASAESSAKEGKTVAKA